MRGAHPWPVVAVWRSLCADCNVDNPSRNSHYRAEGRETSGNAQGGEARVETQGDGAYDPGMKGGILDQDGIHYDTWVRKHS